MIGISRHGYYLLRIHMALQDLLIAHPWPVILYWDNKATLYIAAKPVFHEQRKHIEEDCHFVQDQFQHGHVQTCYVASHH